jgi:purine catabolism regulator
VRTLGEIHGLYTDKPYVCLVVEIHSNQKGAPRFHPISGIYLRLGAEADNYPLEKAISKLVERTTAHEYGGAVTIVRPNKIIVFLPVDSDTDKRTTKLDIRALANRMHENIKSKFEQLDYSIGIGQPCQTVLDLKQSFLEALEAIRMARKIACSHRIAHFEDFMVYHLLDTISDQGELENFFHNTVGKLVQYDQDNNTDFVKTLEVFFTCKGNVSDAAKQLFIHRNTMMYRLDRIKSILSVDLEDAEQLLELNLGLKAMRVLTLQEKKPGSK